jgi:aryl-alcohol dehydrogenase-like predicted oxidoreductase
MEIRKLGNTDLMVSRLGAGTAEIGELTLEQIRTAGRVLRMALDRGICFLDTSACYGMSEELIGRTVAFRRHEYVLATKCGHVTGGYEGEEWTAATIRDSIERSLRRLKTDHLDLVQLHSCDVEVLERGEAIRALLDARDAGKTRYVGYSGDNDAARWAVESGYFDTLQTSFNLVDQRARFELFPLAKARGMGIIAKRPVANGAWGAPASPSEYAAQYFARAEEMARLGPIAGMPSHRILLAIGFVLAHDEVDTAIAGTSSAMHMQVNLDWVTEELPIAASAVEDLHRRFEQVGQAWPQLT